ncbi:MAG: oxygen-independent coproporphyrinogen III oxidase [Oligoflexia bacterium]|nr:oxygen-independent coproporphyrinogen III oxidase [Oligoflexia bacterium]
MTKSSVFKKYNVPGPRYTSYPTVPYWTTTPTETQWVDCVREALREAAQRSIGAAMYVHIPFCESLCTYCGCNTRITRNRKVGTPYVDTVIREWKLYFDKLGGSGKIPLGELHLGGGTPTFLEPEELERLINGLMAFSTRTPEAEFSLEADPRVTTEAHLQTLARLGFTRLSLGIQDFDPKVQEAVHRVQSIEQVARSTEQARAHGYKSVNYDLIYGLPFQNEQSIERTVAAVRDLRPDRIAFYSYAHVPWIKPGQRRFTEADLPGGDQKRALYELGRSMLEEAGYREIGMDHFALESDSLWTASRDGSLHRNFMGYTSRQVSPLIGLGVSAIGDSWTAFAQNEKVLETYQARVEKGELPILRGHVLDEEDRVIRRHILNLMTSLKTDWNDASLAVPYLDVVPEKLAELERDGLVCLSKSSCEVTEEGRPFLRNICMAFDARLARLSPSTRIFSQTI